MKKIFLSVSLILGLLSLAKASEMDLLATLTNVKTMPTQDLK